MLMTWKHSATIVGQMFMQETFAQQAHLLAGVLYNKARATLLKRVRSMSKITNYFRDRGLPFPCAEMDFYVERCNSAPPSKLKGFLEANSLGMFWVWKNFNLF